MKKEWVTQTENKEIKKDLIKKFKLNFLAVGLSLFGLSFGMSEKASAELLFSNESFGSTALISIEKTEPKKLINVKNNEKKTELNNKKGLNSSTTMGQNASKSLTKPPETKTTTTNPTLFKGDIKKQDIAKTAQYNPQIVGKHKKGGTCWDSAAKYHGVDPWLLYSIAYTESRFNPNAVGKNKNGTYDLGMMQINDRVWLPKLNKMGITKKMLKDPCVSIYVGAWILKQNINEFGYTAKAIGAYNSRTPVHNQRYAKKVYEAYAKFTKIYKMQK